MADIPYNENPTISDNILFDLITTENDIPVDVYKITQVVIYFLSRSRIPNNPGNIPVEVTGTTLDEDFYQAEVTAIFGTSDSPAWLVTDPDGSVLSNIETATYQLKWVQELSREGDYILCYRYNVIEAGDEQIKSIKFRILGDTSATTSIPTHRTDPTKYTMLMDRFLPKTYKQPLSGNDNTYEVLTALNTVIADGFTDIENLYNQIIDLLDSNALKDSLLPYLGNLFNLKLRSNDTQLWRRQIKTAVEIFKQKGTLVGLRKALANAGIELLTYIQHWQVRSSCLYQEGFIVSDESSFELSKIIILPIDTLNFELAIRPSGSDTYEILDETYVSFSTSNGISTMQWISTTLDLQEGDYLRVLYKFSPVLNQTLEDYLRTLPLLDDRDEIDFDYPRKNWNTKLIDENDDMFEIACPIKHPISPDVIWGKVRTEFPYGEKTYFMEEYNGSLRDSNYPCDMDKNFQDPCSCGISSKFSADIAIENLSGESILEAFNIFDDYKPFHAIIHQIGLTSSVNDVILSPLEEIEFLIKINTNDNPLATQTTFNRLAPNSLTRSDLASPSTIFTGSGTGKNIFVTFYSPGVKFGTLTVSTNNILEILSGTSAGNYFVSAYSDYLLRIEDSISDFIDETEVAYRFSNIIREESGISVYQDDLFKFSSIELDITEYPVENGWFITILSGPYAGTYTINEVFSDNSVSIEDFPSSGSVDNLSYQLKNESSSVISSGTLGEVAVTQRGRFEFSDLTNIQIGDYVNYSGTQYKVQSINESGVVASSYSSGDVVGTVIAEVLRREASGVGYLSYFGMIIDGTIPTIDSTIENNEFLENYAIEIDSEYYQITNIDGSEMTVIGNPLTLGLSGMSVNYSIIQYIKTSPVLNFDRIDRRGNDDYTIESEPVSSMMMSMYSSESIEIKIEKV